MDLNSIIDFANQAQEEIGRFKFDVIISPKQLKAEDYVLEALEWHSILYGEAELDRVPDDKRGIYAFAICHQNQVLPHHGYVLYIGIAGKDSNRSLRERYRDYLNGKKVVQRVRIARMIGTWHEVLRFFYV